MKSIYICTMIVSGCVIVWQLIGMVLDARSARKQDLIRMNLKTPPPLTEKKETRSW